VARRGWLNEAAYTDILAICQFLPGPASSQVGIILGLMRAGLPGALAAWTGFTLPSAFALILFADLPAERARSTSDLPALVFAAHWNFALLG